MTSHRDLKKVLSQSCFYNLSSSFSTSHYKKLSKAFKTSLAKKKRLRKGKNYIKDEETWIGLKWLLVTFSFSHYISIEPHSLDVFKLCKISLNFTTIRGWEAKPASSVLFCFSLSSSQSRRNPLNGLVHRVILSFDKIISKLDTTIKFIARKQ